MNSREDRDTDTTPEVGPALLSEFGAATPIPHSKPWLLDRKGVAYTEHDATYSPDLRQEMIGKSNGRTTFPQIFIGADHVGGCDDLFALDRAGKLDPMLAA